MSRAKNIAMNAAIVVLWAVALWAVMSLLFGCAALEAQDSREGAFRVNADCDDDTVEIEFELNQHAEDASVEVRR